MISHGKEYSRLHFAVQADHAIRCHSMVAMEKACLQLPEITLRMIPELGSRFIPLRKWPKAAAIFHAMISKAEKMTIPEDCELGIVKNCKDLRLID
jgi:enoyl-CoA hydratase / 3-hydroxyacyl-CoA dehydrogenase